MARNHEKQYGKLNRLILWKEKEEYEKKHPTRPRLDILDTPEEIKKWLPSIKADIEFYLKKSQVTCYSDQHIEECKLKVNNLEKEYKAFVWKIAALTPGKLDAVPWTKRPYKRKNDSVAEDQCSKKEFVPISTPILDQEKKHVGDTVILLPNLPLMDEPLLFSFGEKTYALQPNSKPNKSSDFKTNVDDTDNSFDFQKFTDKNIKKSNNFLAVHQQLTVPNLVNYDNSSDSDS